VAEAFVPNPERKSHVNHIDGDRRNNSVDNLEWVTHAENMRHAYEHGDLDPPSLSGEENPNSKLTREEANQIRQRSDESREELADEYGVSPSAITRVWNGSAWGYDTHVGPTGRGEDCYASKLTEDDVRKIRRLNEQGEYSQSDLAEVFEVSQTNIGRIVRRETWKHVE
jgi:DNA-binding XRE family transcriptional regulator